MCLSICNSLPTSKYMGIFMDSHIFSSSRLVICRNGHCFHLRVRNTLTLSISFPSSPLSSHLIPFFPYSHLANKYMRQYHSHSVEQEVEWLYAFDVHANAFFCSFMVTYVLQVYQSFRPFTILSFHF